MIGGVLGGLCKPSSQKPKPKKHDHLGPVPGRQRLAMRRKHGCTNVDVLALLLG